MAHDSHPIAEAFVFVGLGLPPGVGLAERSEIPRIRGTYVDITIREGGGRRSSEGSLSHRFDAVPAL